MRNAIMPAVRAVAGLAFASIAFAPVSAQRAPAAPDSAADRAAVMRVVTSLFDAMRQGDSATVRRVFHPRATLGTAGAARDGTPQPRIDAIDGFARAVGAPHPEPWNERIYDVTVQLDGNMAVVWAPYTFFLGDKLQHCGTNSFQLARGADGWRILSLVDTRRTTGCRTDAGG